MFLWPSTRRVWRSVGSQPPGEQPHAGVQIERGVPLLDRGSRAHEVQQDRCPRGVGLEEARRRDLVLEAPDHLHDHRLAADHRWLPAARATWAGLMLIRRTLDDLG